MPNNDRLHIWTIYDHPIDWPPGFVAREWVILGGGTRATGTIMHAGALVTLQAALTKAGLVRLGRDPRDDAGIVESWV